ncbi:MAG TPA: ArsC/Spx/MgsR family protein [Candidatus Acidoferrum sp.]|nr:ArsC/Spx/MgsR family protein [Candidatus Acidoferrum sp.]
MAKTKIKFLQKPACTTCRKAKDYLEKLGAELELRSLDAEPLSEAELDKMIGARDYKQFLNQRNEFYRTKNMSEKPPTRAEAIKFMANLPNLIRRPVVIRGDQIVLGYDEEAFKRLLK